jgi:hypothetical protein
MPTVNTSPAKATKPRAKAARKRAASSTKTTSTKASARKPRRASTKARRTSAAKPRAASTKARRAGSTKAARASSTKASTRRTTRSRRAKAARTSAVHQFEAAARQGERASRETGIQLGDYAERAVMIPVGAALLARDRVVSTVSDTISTYSSSSKTQAQLRRFERRGVTARKRLEREVRKARLRVERQLRTRRREVEKRVGEIEDRSEAFARNGSDIANRVPELAKEVQDRILALV